MITKIQLRRDTGSNWASNNPILAVAEIGIDTTTFNFKIGNGVDNWNTLNYFSVAVEDVISQAQLNAAIAAIGGDGLTFDSEAGVYDLDLSAVSQSIIPDGDSTRDLGSSNKKWRDLYLSGDTIFLGNILLKENTDGSFGVFKADEAEPTPLEIVLKEGQVTDAELSGASTDIKARFVTHRDATDNPHSVTATQVGLGNVTDESKETMFTDAALTGIPTAPTAAASTNTTQIATTAFVQSEIDSAALALGTNYSVADIAARNALTGLVVGDVVFVADDGDTKWAQYKVTGIGPVVFLKIMDQDIFLNALSAADVKAAYESNADTNAFTDALLGKLNGVEAEAKDDQSASEVPYTDTNQTYALGNNVQSAIYAVDDELIALDGRVDTLETDLSTHTSDSTIHFTQSQISITESQISDLGNYEVADATILKSADIGVSVQGFNANTVVDANYETFNPSGTFANLRAQATTKDDVGLGNVTNESKSTMFTDPTFTGTVTGVTATHVGLGNVTNESKATMFTNAALTGVPIAPTAASSTNTTQIATTAFVLSEIAVIDGGEFN